MNGRIDVRLLRRPDREQYARAVLLLQEIAREAEALNVALAADEITQKQARVRVQKIHGLAATPEVEEWDVERVGEVQADSKEPQVLGGDAKMPCGCLGELRQGNTQMTRLVTAIGFLCTENHKQGDIVPVEVGA